MLGMVRTFIAGCSETCTSKFRRNLVWIRHSAWYSKRCWYGTRDAGQAFEFAVRDDFEVNNFSQGACSPSVNRYKTRRLWYFDTATST